MSLLEATAVWLGIGNFDTKVVSGCETVVSGSTLDGLLESEAFAVSEERTPDGSETGTVAVSVPSEFVITTGTDTIDASLCEGCAKAVEMAPAEIGTEVTRVVSEREIVTGIDTTGGLLVDSTSPEVAPPLVAPPSLDVGVGSV